jgi:polysaccharide pyruvyl transferase WcaK-like protein
MLIVCGTGIVGDYLTGPKGWPFDLFKWSALAVLCRVKVLFLGIGVGPINHPVSRWLIKRSLGFADYRSYRDEASKQYMEAIGFDTNRDTVCPDLVFGLSASLFPSNGDRTGQRPVVGVGLKDYPVTGVGLYEAASGVKETNSYQDYLRIMVTFVIWLCEHGYDVRLLMGDFRHDMRTRQDVIDAIKGRFVEEGRVVAEPALTVEELARQLDETDLVISPRFHNLVLALMLNKPVIALSDHPKLDSLMAGLGLPDYCLSLENLDVDSLTKLFGQLQNDAERLKVYVREKTEKYRKALDEEYALAFAGA